MGKNFEVIFREFADSETFVMSRGLLEDYKAKAAQEAEERIIKLLEEHTHSERETEWEIECDLCERYYGVGLALALIKGENK